MNKLYSATLPELLKVDFGTDVIANNIINHEMAGQRSADNFSDLVKFAINQHCTDAETWKEALKPGEVKVLIAREGCGEKGLRTNSGKWKVSKVCGNSTYSSNKAVIGKSLEAGISLTNDDDTLKGKSELEKELKESRDPKSPFEIAKIGANMAINQFANLTDDQITEIVNSVLSSAAERVAGEQKAA